MHLMYIILKTNLKHMINRSNGLAVIFAGAVLLCASTGLHANSFQEAGILFKQGQYSLALEKTDSFLASKPGDAKARFLKGLITTEQGNISEAVKIFQALTVDYPELPEPYNNLAALYASQGLYDKAKLALEKAIHTHPSYATAHDNLGDIYARLASQAYDRALQPERANTTAKTKLIMIQDLYEDSARSKIFASMDSAAPNQACLEPCKKLEVAAPAIVKTESKPTLPAPPLASLAADKSNDILKVVKAWAAAWSAQKVDSYLAFYADDFKTPAGESRTSWSAVRKERISSPKSIQVNISNATVMFSDNDHATVKFRQSYRANHLKASGSKTLLMVKAGDKWLIQEERAR